MSFEVHPPQNTIVLLMSISGLSPAAFVIEEPWMEAPSLIIASSIHLQLIPLASTTTCVDLTSDAMLSSVQSLLTTILLNQFWREKWNWNFIKKKNFTQPTHFLVIYQINTFRFYFFEMIHRALTAECKDGNLFSYNTLFEV